MTLRYEFRPYATSLRRTVRTARGLLSTRTGILIALTTSEGKTTYGEIAPLPDWGTETYATALDFCASLPSEIDAHTIDTISSALPCCQFAFETAYERAVTTPEKPTPIRALPCAALLPAGQAAIAAAQRAVREGYTTLKWKIATENRSDEIATLHQICSLLPHGTQLRLDANGGLDLSSTKYWLEACENLPIDFLEQPLPVGSEEPILQLSGEFITPIALDESIATHQNLVRWLEFGWPGIYVIKPSLAGSPKRLRSRLLDLEAEAIFSSAFETIIGTQAALRFAFATQYRPRALGFGTFEAFEDVALNVPVAGPKLTSRWLASLDARAAWEHLESSSLAR